MMSLGGCAGPAQVLFNNSIVVDHLDGNYQRLASCTYEHLARQQAQLSMTELREQQTVRIALTQAPLTHWELSGRRGWNRRRALSRASMPSHWPARARHSWLA